MHFKSIAQRVIKRSMCLLLLFIIFLMSVLFRTSFATDAAEQAFEQIRQPVPAGEGLYSLEGPWTFYWKQLLEPADFVTEGSRIPQPAEIVVPGSWTDGGADLGIHEGEQYPKTGYATYRYRFEISADKTGTQQAIFFRYVHSAWKLWINGKRVGERGQVGRSQAEETPQLGLKLLYFSTDQKQVDIVMQVSNFSFRESGLAGEVITGDAAAVQRYVFTKYLIPDLLITGVFLMLAVYHLIAFAVRRKERAYFWYGTMSLLMMLRTLTISEYIVYQLMPSLPWVHLVRIEYVLEMLVICCFVLLLRAVYPQEAPGSLVRITLGIFLAWIAYLVFSPVMQFTSGIMLQWSVVLSVLLHYFVFVGVGAIRNGSDGAKLNMFGLIVMVLSVMHDLLFYTGIIKSIPIGVYGVLMYFVIQTIIMYLRKGQLVRRNQDTNEMPIQN